MKSKITLLAALMVCSMTFSSAQNIIEQGEQVFNLGLGVGSYLKGNGYKTTFPALSLSYEYGVKDNLFDDNSSLGVGAIIGYYAAQTNFQNAAIDKAFGYRYNFLTLGGRVNIHYQFVDRLDTYLGGMLGYNLGFINSYGTGQFGGYTKDKIGGFAYGVYVGGRYYFLEKLAGFAEVGYGISAVTLGLALKL